MSALHVRLWSEAEFASGRETWQALLAGSAADPLFMSWDWQQLWWSRHGQQAGFELQILAIEDGAHRPVGLVPLYRHPSRVMRVVPAARLECVGSQWRSADVAFSEYFDLIAAAAQQDDVAEAVARWLMQTAGWSEWLVPFVRADSAICRVAQRLGARCSIRQVESLDACVVALEEGFDAFLARLAPNTRRRLFGHRRRLDDPRLVETAAEDVDALLVQLHDWRTRRWGASAAGAGVHDFERAAARRFAAHGALQLTQLSSGGRTLSIMLNLRIRDTEYYLASAFSPDAPDGLSPGYLHFGYAIEAACRAGVRRFDLLAGRGRHRDYKLDLRPRIEPLTSLQVLRAPWLRALHGLNHLRQRQAAAG